MLRGGVVLSLCVLAIAGCNRGPARSDATITPKLFSGKDDTVLAEDLPPGDAADLAKATALLVPSQLIGEGGVLETRECCELYDLCPCVLSKHRHRRCVSPGSRPSDPVWATCSAILVGHKHVLTARHCAPGGDDVPGSDPPASVANLRLVFDYWNSSQQGRRVTDVARVVSRYPADKQPFKRGELADRLLLELDACRDRPFVPLSGTGEDAPEVGDPVEIGSHVLGMPKIWSPGELETVKPTSFIVTNDLLTGSSGAGAVVGTGAARRTIGVLADGSSFRSVQGQASDCDPYATRCLRLATAEESASVRKNLIVFPSCVAEPCADAPDASEQVRRLIREGNECCDAGNCSSVAQP